MWSSVVGPRGGCARWAFNAKRNAAEVKSLWPISAGLHTCYKGEDSGPRGGNSVPIPKNQVPSSDCGLQLARMKLKSLVIVNHHVTVKIHRTLHTPPITPEKCGCEETGCAPAPGGPSGICSWVIWAKLTQGNGRGTCRWSIRLVSEKMPCYVEFFV